VESVSIGDRQRLALRGKNTTLQVGRPANTSFFQILSLLRNNNGLYLKILIVPNSLELYAQTVDA